MNLLFNLAANNNNSMATPNLSAHKHQQLKASFIFCLFFESLCLHVRWTTLLERSWKAKMLLPQSAPLKWVNLFSFCPLQLPKHVATWETSELTTYSSNKLSLLKGFYCSGCRMLFCKALWWRVTCYMAKESWYKIT